MDVIYNGQSFTFVVDETAYQQGGVRNELNPFNPLAVFEGGKLENQIMEYPLLIATTIGVTSGQRDYIDPFLFFDLSKLEHRSDYQDILDARSRAIGNKASPKDTNAGTEYITLIAKALVEEYGISSNQDLSMFITHVDLSRLVRLTSWYLSTTKESIFTIPNKYVSPLGTWCTVMNSLIPMSYEHLVGFFAHLTGGFLDSRNINTIAEALRSRGAPIADGESLKVIQITATATSQESFHGRGLIQTEKGPKLETSGDSWLLVMGDKGFRTVLKMSVKSDMFRPDSGNRRLGQFTSTLQGSFSKEKHSGIYPVIEIHEMTGYDLEGNLLHTRVWRLTSESPDWTYLEREFERQLDVLSLRLSSVMSVADSLGIDADIVRKSSLPLVQLLESFGRIPESFSLDIPINNRVLLYNARGHASIVEDMAIAYQQMKSIFRLIFLFREHLGFLFPQDPGPLIEDLRPEYFYAILAWLRNILDLSDKLEQLQNYHYVTTDWLEPWPFATWVTDLVLDGALTDPLVSMPPGVSMTPTDWSTLRLMMLNTIGLLGLDDSALYNLADNWDERGVSFAYISRTESESEPWQLSFLPDRTEFPVPTGNYDISQIIRAERSMTIDSILLGLQPGTEAGELQIQVSANGITATGTATASAVGLSEVGLSRTLSVSEGDTVTIIIHGNASSETLISASRISGLTNTKHFDSVKVLGSPVDDVVLLAGLHDRESQATQGWRSVGVKAISDVRYTGGNPMTVDDLVLQAETQLQGYFALYPDMHDELSKIIIVATLLDEEEDAVTVESKTYVDRGSPVVSTLASDDGVPVWVYSGGESIGIRASNLLSFSAGRDVLLLNDAQLVDAMELMSPGILILMTDEIPESCLAIDDSGEPLIRRWLSAGNQIVAANRAPMETVEGTPLQTYALSNGIGLPNSGRLKALSYTQGSGVTTQSVDSYRGGTVQTKRIQLTGSSSYIEFESTGCPTSPGTVTFMAGISIAKSLDKEFSVVDVKVDGITLIDDLMLDSFRDDTGAGLSATIQYDRSTRLYMHYLGDTSSTAQFLMMVTTDRLAGSTSHIVSIHDDTRNLSRDTFTIDFLTYTDYVSWHRSNDRLVWTQIESRYSGIPAVAPGLALLLGEEAVITDYDLSQDYIAIESVYGLGVSRNSYALDLNKLEVVHTHGLSANTLYGKASVRSAGGLVTVLDIGSNWMPDQVIEEVSLIVFGVAADLYRLDFSGMVSDGFPIEYSGPVFNGLELTLEQWQPLIHVYQGTNPNVDFDRTDGWFSTSLSEDSPVTMVSDSNSDVTMANGTALVIPVSDGVFSSRLSDTNLGISESNTPYLMIGIWANDTTIEVIGDATTVATVDPSSDMGIIVRLDSGQTINDLKFQGTPIAGSSLSHRYFEVGYVHTADTPYTQSWHSTGFS
ncbi:MAG: hypothetical protein ACFFER_15050, partial [Candidatus Thorarchaeota archaeon]